MIRNVKEIWIRPVDVDDSISEWSRLALVPGTATINVETTLEDAGKLKTYSLSATLQRQHKYLFSNLQVRILYDRGRETFGNRDIPVQFELKRENALIISAKYKTRADL